MSLFRVKIISTSEDRQSPKDYVLFDFSGTKEVVFALLRQLIHGGKWKLIRTEIPHGAFTLELFGNIITMRMASSEFPVELYSILRTYKYLGIDVAVQPVKDTDA